MLKNFKFWVVILAAGLIFGCATTKTGVVASPKVHTVKTLAAKALPENDPATGNMLVRKAKSALGTPYIYGGSKPGGFDCSGLVKWAYNSVGVELPRTAREQSVVGKKVQDVKDMRAGDIVAFRHPKRGYHTGIYVGGGKFVHSPRKRSHVRINSLSDPYFRDTLLGARRVKLDGSENLVAQAESRLRDYVEKQTVMSMSARNKAKMAASKATAQAKTAKKSVKAAKANARNNQTVKPANAKSTRKSEIAQQARKVQSVKQITGKSKSVSKNGAAHDKLASASKKTTSKTVSMLQTKKQQKATPRKHHS